MEETESKEEESGKISQRIAQRRKTPVLDNFSTDLLKIIEIDYQKGIDYLYRESEINSVLKVLLKNDKPHIAIVGQPGTGRETIVKTVCATISNGNTSTRLNRTRFVKFDFDDIVAGTKYRGQLEERLKAVLHEVESTDENIVLFMEQVYHAIFPGVESSSSELASLKAIVKSKNVRVLTVLTTEQAEKLFESEYYYGSYFNIVKVSPPSIEETIAILKCHLSRFRYLYSVDIDESLIPEAIEFSNLYMPDGYQPLKALSIMEEASAEKDLYRQSNPNDILYNLKINFNKINEEIISIRNEKNEVVKRKDYEQAARLRDMEKELFDSIEECRLTIDKARSENHVSLCLEDIIGAVHSQTGIDIEKIRKKQIVLVKTKQNSRSEVIGVPQFEVLQTQSILHGHQVSIKTGLAFVLIPHNKEFDDLFYHFIKPALEVHGLTVLKADNIFKPGNILSQVWAQIRSAEIIVADVSGQNPNVIFELGLCYGIQRCPILLTRDATDLPFNIRNLRYIQYNDSASGANKLREDLNIATGELLSAVRSENF